MRATVVGLLRYMNAGDFIRTVSDKASTPQTEPHASSAADGETNDIGELEVENDEEHKDKYSHAIDCGDSALPQTFQMMSNIVLEVQLDVVQAIAGCRPPGKFKKRIPREPSFPHHC